MYWRAVCVTLSGLGCLFACFGVLVVCVSPGCQKHSSSPAPQRNAVVKYGQLPGVKQTHHRGLREEISRLEDEKVTPHLLELRESLRSPVLDEDGVDESNETRATWLHVFKTSEIESLDRKLEGLFGTNPFRLSAHERRRALDFANRYVAQMEKIRASLRRKNRRLSIRHTHGFLADTSFVEIGRIYVRLEQIRAADRFDKEGAGAVEESFSFMFQMLHRLAEVPHVVSRLAAAQLRREVLSGLQVVVRDKRTRRSVFERLYRLVLVQLDHWPRDANAWIGDRALGLHAYEMIRAGYLSSLLSFNELHEFREDGTLARLVNATERIDEDEYYYLRTMRRVIQSCEFPYYERVDLLSDLRDEQGRIRQDADCPIIAIKLLLEGIESAHRLQALDRALCEAWRLGLAAALQHDFEPQRLNPLTGEPYVIVREKNSVSVWGAAIYGGEDPVTVPLVGIRQPTSGD